MEERRHVVIGLAGMAKNTGKTTVTQALINAAHSQGLQLGLTSIGYDGEAWDNVTRLPKPRIVVPAGTVIATADSCLKAGSAKVGQVSAVESHTPLGQVVIGTVQTAGTVVLAGPHTARELRVVSRSLATLGSQLTIVDGAINRIMPMSCTDGIILATGAARCQDISQLAREVAAIFKLFTVPIVDGSSAALTPESLENDLDHISLFGDGQRCGMLTSGSLLSRESAMALASDLEDGISTVYVPGQASTESLQQLFDQLESRARSLLIVLADPLRLLLAGEPLRTAGLLDAMADHGINVAVKRAVQLLAVTVNPFYPLWRYESDDYQPAYIDAERLQKEVQAAVTTPVVDIKRDGAEQLLSVITDCYRSPATSCQVANAECQG